MLKKIFILSIFILIISTTLIKNYTKNLDEQIFSVKENINYLNSVQELVQLEHDYLSSPETLLELKNLYFEDDLKYTPRKRIEIIDNFNQIIFEKKVENEQWK